MKTFIAAPTSAIARHIDSNLRNESWGPILVVRPTFITPDDSFAHQRLQGIEKCNLIVAVSGREFLSMQEWPVFVKRLRIVFETYCQRGPASYMSKWIEVYLP